MRFLADENFPGAGASDTAVLDLATQGRRIILTFDKDFGELARKSKLPDACGVILFRIPLPAPATAAG
jgi:predicted nuclease of predicted toxin-antitoxin system